MSSVWSHHLHQSQNILNRLGNLDAAICVCWRCLGQQYDAVKCPLHSNHAKAVDVCLAAAQTACRLLTASFVCTATQHAWQGLQRGTLYIAAQLTAPLDCILCQLVSVTQLAGIL